MWKIMRLLCMLGTFSLVQAQTVTQMTADQIAMYLKALPSGQSAVVTLTVVAVPQTPAQKMGIMFPFYIYPTAAALQPLLAAKQQYPQVPLMVILNPNSGVGSAVDQNYVNAVVSLQRAGIIVVGYVATGYAARATSSVQAEIDRWLQWYKPNGIFFDEASATNVAYYQNLDAYVHSKGMAYAIANPGTNVTTAYGNAVDITVIGEGASLPNLANYANWQNAGYLAQKAAMIYYNQPSISQTFLANIQKYVGWIYLTNDSGANPYDAYPTYFNQLVASVNQYGSYPPPTTPSYSTVIVKTV